MKVPLVLTVCILLAFFVIRGQCCGPAEISKQYTILSTANVTHAAAVRWGFGDLGTTLYDSQTLGPNKYPNLYIGTRTQLTVLRVTKNDGTGEFKHNVNGYVLYTCRLPVYKRAASPTCELLTLTGKEISTKCTTAQVFPMAKCQFLLQNGIDSRTIADEASYITYTHTDPQQGGNEYYKTSCTLQYPVNGLKPGNWTVQVKMYPNQTGVSMAQGTTGQAVNTAQLSLPTVNIDPNSCPKGLDGEGETNVKDGYIKQGERASCRCLLSYAGNPPGTISWSSNQGSNFDNVTQSDNAVTIQINSPDTFTCQSTSVLDGSHSMTFTPKYAHGPTSANLTFQRSGPIYLCPGQQTSIDITCQVPANSFNPATLFTIRDGNSNNLVTKVAGDNAWSKSVNYSFTKSGQHTFTCQVENAVFSSMYSEAPATAIQVYAPPKDPPVISARSSQYGDILVDGDNVTVICDASGANPPVLSVTLTCNHSTSVTSNGTSAQLALNYIGLEFNETNCTCQATHVTGCYDLMGVLVLTVTESNQTISEQEDSPPIGAAVGGAIGAFVVIAVVVGGIFFIRRRKKKKDQPSPEAGGYDPYQDPIAVIRENDLYGTAVKGEQVSVPAKDYTTVTPTMKSATAVPKKYNPENVDRPYEDVNPVELDRKSLFKKSKTSLEKNAVPKPGEQAQNNTNSEYATVAKRKPPNSKSSDHDQTDDVTTAGASGAMPVVPNKLYDKDELEDSVNQQSASKGKQKKTKEKSAKKEKKKDKKEKKKKGKDTDDEHIYSNETFDHRGDVDVYANITMGMKSSNDVDDGMHKNKDGLVYTTIVGVGSLKGAQRPVHHQRKEAPVDYADIDFNKIVANREDQD